MRFRDLLEVGKAQVAAKAQVKQEAAKQLAVAQLVPVVCCSFRLGFLAVAHMIFIFFGAKLDLKFSYILLFLYFMQQHASNGRVR